MYQYGNSERQRVNASALDQYTIQASALVRAETRITMANVKRSHSMQTVNNMIA